MSGYLLYRQFIDVEQKAAALGFRFAFPNQGCREVDCIALMPKDDCLPDYSRDAELFVGTLVQVGAFLRGIEFNKQYYTMLKLVSDKKVEEKEQITRNRQLMYLMKNDKQEELVK